MQRKQRFSLFFSLSLSLSLSIAHPALPVVIVRVYYGSAARRNRFLFSFFFFRCFHFLLNRLDKSEAKYTTTVPYKKDRLLLLALDKLI